MKEKTSEKGEYQGSLTKTKGKADAKGFRNRGGKRQGSKVIFIPKKSIIRFGDRTKKRWGWVMGQKNAKGRGGEVNHSFHRKGGKQATWETHDKGINERKGVANIDLLNFTNSKSTLPLQHHQVD